MPLNRKIAITASLVTLVVISIAATTPQPHPGPKNLKVLPKDINHEDLEHIMHGFNDALGVKCNYCHAQSKEDPHRLDFSSDEKDEKKMARFMMKMTMKVNKKFFHVKSPAIGDTVSVVRCMTCHHGDPHPESK